MAEEEPGINIRGAQPLIAISYQSTSIGISVTVTGDSLAEVYKYLDKVIDDVVKKKLQKKK